MLNYNRVTKNIPPYSVTTFDFNGNSPNYFRVVNGGSATLYCGMASMPTARLYDFKVESNQSRMYCEDRGYPKLYIFNSSGSATDVILTSFTAPFSPEVMAFCDFNISENETQTVDVEISGFTQSLPAGSNNIGSVNVANQNNYNSALADILLAIGNISSGGGTPTDYSTALANILSAIGNNAPINYGTVLTNILNAMAEKDCYSETSEGTSTTTGSTFYTANNYAITTIRFLSNDGTGDITLTICDLLDASEHTLTVKAGEVLNDITIKAGWIKIAGSNVPYRMLYELRGL